MKLETCENRLKTMIVIDKQESPQKISKLLKSELLFMLRNYFDIYADDLILDICVNEAGRYEILIKAESNNVKVAHLFSDT